MIGPEGRGAGGEGRAEAAAVAVGDQRRDQDAGGGGAVGDGRAGDAGEEDVADDGGLGEAAADVADQGAGEAEQALADAALVHEGTGQGEERDGQEREGLEAGDDALGHDGERDPLQEDDEAGGRDHGDRDRRADQEEEGEGDEEDGHATWLSSTAATGSAGQSVSPTPCSRTWRRMWRQERAAPTGRAATPQAAEMRSIGVSLDASIIACSTPNQTSARSVREGDEHGHGTDDPPGPARQDEQQHVDADVHAGAEGAGEPDEEHPAEEGDDELLGPDQRIAQDVAVEDGEEDEAGDQPVGRGEEQVLGAPYKVVQPCKGCGGHLSCRGPWRSPGAGGPGSQGPSGPGARPAPWSPQPGRPRGRAR